MKVLASNYIWEVSLPGVSLQRLNNLNGFGDLVNMIVGLAYRAALLFMLYKLIVVGFKYMTNQGNADVVKAASEGLKNILFGALILFGSYIILYTINPKLTEFPQQLYCDPKIADCEKKNTGKSNTHVYTTCPSIIEDPREDETQAADGGTKSEDSTDDNGISPTTIKDFIDANDAYLAQHGDWTSAQQDFQTGKVSNSVWEAFKLITDLRKKWYSDGCGKLVWGPIFTNHEKPAGSTYTSCHDTYEAIDLVVNDEYGKTSIKCTTEFLKYIKTSGVASATGVIICDETNFSDVTPHIHISDTNCNSGCRVS